MSNPFFSFKKFTIRQDKATLKVTTDACLLGAYAKAVNPGTILDIGTGTGILAVMLAQRYSDAWIDALEPDKETAEQARLNVKSCPWGERIRVITSRIQDFIKTLEKKYDLIICNPPYHASQLFSKDEKTNLARHSLDLSFPELSFAIDQLISEQGRFYVIVPPGPFLHMEKELGPYGIHRVDQLSIYNLPDKPLYRMIGGFSRGMKKANENALLIMNEGKSYTPEFRELLKDFYLAF